MKIIGLTGNTGSGKSQICDILKEEGALIIDADEISHKMILKGNPAYKEVVDFFSREILDSNGEIDRKRLGAIVFKDKKKLNYLSQIIHKYVILETEKIIANAKGKYDLIIIDAPLLIESGINKNCGEVWLVYASHDTRLKRIMERDRLSEEEALLRMQSQTHFDKLIPFATKIIYNESCHEDLVEQVKNVLCDYHKKTT